MVQGTGWTQIYNDRFITTGLQIHCYHGCLPCTTATRTTYQTGFGPIVITEAREKLHFLSDSFTNKTWHSQTSAQAASR